MIEMHARSSAAAAAVAPPAAGADSQCVFRFDLSLGGIAFAQCGRCGISLQVQRGLCVCLFVTTMSCAETDEPIEMPFGVWTRVSPNVGPDPLRERGNFGESVGYIPVHYEV